ncbi:killer cell lectin-like receptor subfamily B member 1B allele B [Lepidochelys kempii]|uniref:killer cell lectin-like receptor subfamily B member 1B allele B n=1 Tax=Lepidochelys kempii TaxID=8472 RepID=UPI003C6EAC36
MAGEIVYADLNIPEAFSTSKSLHPSQHPNIPQCPRWHRLALWLGWAGNIILVAAVIALGVSGQTGRPRTTNGIECNSSLKDSQSCSNQSVYPKPDNNSTEGCECKLCPADWLPHKNKCYWVSKESKTWNESRVDCSAKSSQMLVIQDKEEMAYILSIPQLNLVWLGLSVTSPERKWTWVDGSTFDETLFQLTGAAERESCVLMKGNCAISETCLALAKWICEKVALK